MKITIQEDRPKILTIHSVPIGKWFERDGHYGIFLKVEGGRFYSSQTDTILGWQETMSNRSIPDCRLLEPTEMIFVRTRR